MDIEPLKITIRELVENYTDNAESGVFGFGGKLNIRPAYQREFIYKDKQRDAVVQTVLDKYPLNVMYWADNGNGTFEVIDGQQRTISICQYVTGVFSYNYMKFESLPIEKREKILDYELMVYVCKGESDEKLKWFETINIAGEKLTKQELRNAVYSGPFVTEAKRYFSKSNGPAYNLAKEILNGSAIRQDYLETALEWICYSQGINDVRTYMDQHRNDTTIIQLWNYFTNVINWVKSFINVTKRKSIVQGLNWGRYYEMYKDRTDLDKFKIDNQIISLLKDGEITNKKGIIPFILSGDERHLGLRTFGEDIRETVYEEQNGVCHICGEHFELCEMEADHIIPWSKGGKTVKENCQMLCLHCNRTKSNK